MNLISMGAMGANGCNAPDCTVHGGVQQVQQPIGLHLCTLHPPEIKTPGNLNLNFHRPRHPLVLGVTTCPPRRARASPPRRFSASDSQKKTSMHLQIKTKGLS